MLEFVRKGYGDDIFLKSDVNPKYSFNDVYMTRDVEGGELIVSYTNIENVYRYGLISNRDSYGHGPGYVWSSRVGVLNLTFETDFVDVVINNCSGYCMRVKEVEKLLPEGCSFERYEQFDDKEPYYRLVGYQQLDWFAESDGIHMFETTSPVEEDSMMHSTDGVVELYATNYPGIFTFDEQEHISNRYNARTRRLERKSLFDDASDEVKNEYVEVYVNRKYGYCASKEYLKEKFPERFKYKFL